MKFNELSLTKNKKSKRLGRGIASGKGKTAGRGTEGQKARTGYSRNPGFSGGQNPLMQQLPKLPGFKSKKIKAENISTKDLNELKSTTIDAQLLSEAGLISSAYVNVKLLNSDKLKKAYEVRLPYASKTAIFNIEEAGGQFIKTPRIIRPKTAKKDNLK